MPMRSAGPCHLSLQGGREYRNDVANHKTVALRGILLAALLALGLGVELAAEAAPRQVLHTPGYESPVHGDPDDLLQIGGFGFEAGDRVVYEAVGTGDKAGGHPPSVPAESGHLSGTAPVVSIADPSTSMTVRLPQEMEAHRAYRLWVVNAAGEWSPTITINDPRPLWLTPAYVHETADPAQLGRRLKVVGRNLLAPGGGYSQIRLQGPKTYLLTSAPRGDEPATFRDYVAEGALPARMAVGRYRVSISRDGHEWVDAMTQQLEVKPDPPTLQEFAVNEARFGGCRPGDGAPDDSCFAKAIAAAQRQGGGNIVIPPGIWDLSVTADLVLPRNVNLISPSHQAATIVRHDARKVGRRPGGLFTLTGGNSIIGVKFTDTDQFESPAQSRPIIQLGAPLPTSNSGAAAEPVTDVIISANDFHRVGRAVEDSGRPLARLIITHNQFAAYDRDLQLPGSHFGVAAPYRIDDSIVRWNRFIPGSFIDVSGHQGSIGGELGASHRLDFSDNIADGAATDGLQKPEDPRGFRAAFFWNLNGNQEMLLVARNQINCSGDKAGDGEALSFDGNGDTFALTGAPPVAAAGSNTVTVHAPLLGVPGSQPVDRARFYVGHWVQVVAGPGTGQVRKIESYVEDPASGTVTFKVATPWDIVPGDGSRIVVGRDYWQVYALANEVDHRAPPCTKGNLTQPAGGVIAMWAPSADTVFAGNQQYDSSGILFLMSYNYPDPACRDCSNGSSNQTALEIRDNVISGEYDWSSDCSRSGISASLSVAPTPQAPPPIEGFGISIAHNHISQADGMRGGAIGLAATWYLGPPGNWQLAQGLLIQHNTLSDLDGGSPRPRCRFGQKGRVGIRFEGAERMQDSVLYGNRCERVDKPLEGTERGTLRVCAPSAGSCECAVETGSAH